MPALFPVMLKWSLKKNIYFNWPKAWFYGEFLECWGNSLLKDLIRSSYIQEQRQHLWQDLNFEVFPAYC